MRVEVIASPVENDETWEAFSDAPVERALKNFFAAVGSDDSLFAAESAGVMLGNRTDDGQRICRAAFVVKFREERQASSRAFHFSLIERLSELLKAAGSAESLGAALCLIPGEAAE